MARKQAKKRIWTNVTVYYKDSSGVDCQHPFTVISNSLEDTIDYCKGYITHNYILANLSVSKFVITYNGNTTEVEV